MRAAARAAGVDVFEALRRRRTHRAFAPEPLDDADLRALAWAATRAPVGGNEPSRLVVVVRDRALVQTLVQVTPSYIGSLPPAILCVCTDERLAEEQMGRLGREHLSRVDAGAAAANVMLAAVALGLGCYVFRCANDAAMREVLELPVQVRVDVLAAVGRPARTPSPAARAAAQQVHLDRYGVPWEVGRP